MASEHLGRTLRRLRRLADLTQEELAERANVSVDVIRQLEQGRKHSARLPTLHALANGLGVELTTLLGDPPAVASGENDGPRFVAVRRAIMPVLWGPPQGPIGQGFSPSGLRDQIADAWTQYHAAEFDAVMKALPDLIAEARSASVSGSDDDRAGGFAALGKALQLGGHVAVRMGKTDLASASLERATSAAEQSADPLLVPMIVNSMAWTYQRQGRLEDALTPVDPYVDPGELRAEPRWPSAVADAFGSANRRPSRSPSRRRGPRVGMIRMVGMVLMRARQPPAARYEGSPFNDDASLLIVIAKRAGFLRLTGEIPLPPRWERPAAGYLHGSSASRMRPEPSPRVTGPAQRGGATRPTS